VRVWGDPVGSPCFVGGEGMVAWFVRRVVGGLVTFVVASCVLHLLLFEYAFPRCGYIIECAIIDTFIPNQNERVYETAQRYEALFDLDKPWPLSYVAWLFDPDDTTRLDKETNAVVPSGVDVSIFGLRIQGSGLLTGDFGETVLVRGGIPISEIFGHGLHELFAALTGLIIAFTLVANFQRVGRPTVYPPATQLGSSAVWDRALQAMGYPRVP
jgi:hypothetical protein